jgi:hypothetical protein
MQQQEINSKTLLSDAGTADVGTLLAEGKRVGGSRDRSVQPQKPPQLRDPSAYPSCGLVPSRGALPNLVVGAVLRPEDTWPPREPPYSYTGPGVSLFVAWSREEDPKRGVGAEVNTAERPKESAVV